MFCTVEGCFKDSETKLGYCVMHYKRWKRNGTTDRVLADNSNKFNCEFCGEITIRLRKGLCKPCSLRKYKKGTPERSINKKGEASFLRNGYHVINDENGKQVYAHRYIAGAESGEVVHHVKGKSNDPDNLLIFPNQSEHIKHHAATDPNWGKHK